MLFNRLNHTLNDLLSGITYIREFLHLPPEIVPATLRRQARTETARPRPKGALVCKPFKSEI